MSYLDKQPVEHLAAVDDQGQLHVFFRMPWTDWQVVNVSEKASMRVQYAAADLGGVWRSNDYGINWFQLTQPQPAEGFRAEGTLNSPVVMDVVVSPEDPDTVLAAVIDVSRKKPLSGIYQSTNGGKYWSLVHQSCYTSVTELSSVKQKCTDKDKPAHVTQIRWAPDDPKTVFAATESGVAMSKNSGATWIETNFPKTSMIPSFIHVWHIAVGPEEPDGNRRLYACGNGKLWYSPDEGASWFEDFGVETIASKIKHPDPWICEEPNAGNGTASQIMEVEPGHPEHLYLAYKHLANGPRYFAQDIAPDGKTWILTPETDGETCNTYQPYTEDHADDLGKPGEILGCGEGSVWFGDFSNFKKGLATQEASWEQLPGPPEYWGVSTPSGRAYLKVHPIPGSYLLFFSNRTHVHMSIGKPQAGKWHRLDGLDITKTWKDYTEGKGELQNRLVMHVDPHTILVSPDFNLTLKKPEGIDPQYDKSLELDTCISGRIWMGNDGGFFSSNNCGDTWEIPYQGTKTLIPINIAGLAFRGKTARTLHGHRR